MNLLTSKMMPRLDQMNKRDILELIRGFLIQEMTNEKMDNLLELLLDAMSLVFVFNKKFRRNIDRFQAKYTFRIGENGTGASAIFSPIKFLGTGRMRVKDEPVEDADITVSFKDGRSMAEFLFSENPDIISALLDNKLSFKGNLNYLFKFAYMARHLPRTLGIQLQV